MLTAVEHTVHAISAVVQTVPVGTIVDPEIWTLKTAEIKS